MSQLILASGSRWRKKLLSWLDVSFNVIESGFDERSVSFDDPEELVMVLAQRKAESVAAASSEAVVIGADTVIALLNVDGEWEVIGKPDDLAHARAILMRLKGREHSVFTGLAVVDSTTGEKIVEVEETRVVFRDFSEQVLEAYLSTGDSMGKAGGYQILAIKDTLVQSIEGSVTNVIGLPLSRVKGMLEEMGVQIEVVTEDVVWQEINFRD